MFYLIQLLIALSACLIFSQSQSETPWLDPATYPNAMDLIATPGMVDEYSGYCHGTKTYTVRQTKEGLDPVIDGVLEDNIWYAADTLIINSWQDAGTQAYGDNPKFRGPQDLHAIWRFCYNRNALYLSCEVHDDILDVDGLKGWNAQDGVELAIDPYDWGEFANGNWSKNIFRQYWSNNATINSFPYDAQNCLIHLFKRANTEQYLAGFIRGTLLNNYNRGDEATNFLAGSSTRIGGSNVYGIEAAAQKRGVDEWGRTVFQYEFKFPFTTDLWKELKATGFYGEDKMPMGRFKMNLANNDDDYPGLDGINGNTSMLIRSRNFKDALNDPFVIRDTHWSETNYMMTFKYGGIPGEICHPWPRSDINMKAHGHWSILSTWVDAATETIPYTFTDGGTCIIDNHTYYYDSLPGNSNSGEITNIKGGPIFGTYTVSRPNPNFNLSDTLILTMNNTPYTLLRKINTGFDQLEKRWVQARRVIKYNNECYSSDTTWEPIAGAKEYRFCPLSKIDKVRIDDHPEYLNCTDSVRIYDYANDSLMHSYSYTATHAIVGRDSIVFSIEIKKIIHESNPTSPRDPYNLLITYNNHAVDTLVEIQLYPTIAFNATKAGDQGKLWLYPINSVDSISKLQVTNKFTGSVVFFPDIDASSAATRVFGTFYNDGMVLLTDNSRSNFWTKLCKSWITLDTNYLVINNSDTTIIKKNPDSMIDISISPKIQLVTTIVLNAKQGVNDTFVVKSIDSVFYWDFNYPLPSGMYGAIDTMKCTGIEQAAATDDIKVITVDNYPNPFNPSTTLRFAIPYQKVDERYGLNIYNIKGQLVRILEKGVIGNRGLIRKVVWDGTDNLGMTVGAGIYFYRLNVGTKIKKGSMVFVK